MMGYITWVATAGPASPVLGSTSLTTASSGVIISEVRYKPYGEIRWNNGTNVTDFGFTSQRNEASFGLMDYNARYYSPVLGRFVSPDSIVPEPGSSGGFNRYRYTRNNPLKYVDPSGHYTVDPDTGECFGGNCDEFWDGPPPDDGDRSGLFDVEDIDHPAGKIAFGLPKRPPVNQEAAEMLSAAAATFDGFAMILSTLAFGGAMVAGTATLEAGGLPGYELVNLGYQASIGNFENALGVGSFILTAGADVAAGNTYISDEGLVIGQDTYVSFVLDGFGFIPDVTTDLALNAASMYYNGESMRGHPGITGELPGNMFISKYWVVPRVPPTPQLDDPDF